MFRATIITCLSLFALRGWQFQMWEIFLVQSVLLFLSWPLSSKMFIIMILPLIRNVHFLMDSSRKVDHFLFLLVFFKQICNVSKLGSKQGLKKQRFLKSTLLRNFQELGRFNLLDIQNSRHMNNWNLKLPSLELSFLW